MLWTIFVILLVLWLLGMVSSYTLGGFIHILLVLAVVVVLIRVIQGRVRSLKSAGKGRFGLPSQFHHCGRCPPAAMKKANRIGTALRLTVSRAVRCENFFSFV